MTENATPEFEALLRKALTPVEPPADLPERLETALLNLTGLAVEELEAWELSSMKDPRNWVRPVAATVVGTAAAGALVVVRTRRKEAQRRDQQRTVRNLAERTIRDVAGEARKLLSP